MSGRAEATGARPPEPESYGKVLVNLGSVLLSVAGLLALVHRGDRPAPRVEPAPAPAAAPAVAAAVPREAPERPKPRPKPAAPRPAPPPPPELDRAAVARAEGSLDAASRDRARAEARAEEAARLLADASRQAAVDAATARRLAYQVRDPSARLARASARGGFLRAERDRLKDEVAAVRKAPRPRAKILADKNPVAKPSGGEEYHFEVRRNRVTFIDLDHLLALVKDDFKRQFQQNPRQPSVESQVGPVGAFSMQYSVGLSLPSSLNELMVRRGVEISLRGWELIPEFEGRGETYEATRQPVSEFSRAINRLTPGHATITMWIYPDGFALYRRLRDDLHARGYMVAARPLPEGVTIRGSPAGSVSAGQ